MLNKYLQIFLYGYLFTLLVFPSFVKANDGSVTGAFDRISFGVASNLNINDDNVQDGNIIITTENGFTKSKNEYESGMVGVVSISPAISINKASDSNPSSQGKEYPVIPNGNVFVSVSSINGNIKKGDLITSSSIAGVGMKSNRNGYVLGSALEEYNSEDTSKIGKISIAINIHYITVSSPIKTKFTDIFKLSALATFEEPIVVFKYFISSIVLIISMLFGFVSFGRLARTGVEALGRNPMASKSIQLGIFFNALISVGILLAGLGISIFIIRF